MISVFSNISCLTKEIDFGAVAMFLNELNSSRLFFFAVILLFSDDKSSVLIATKGAIWNPNASISILLRFVLSFFGDDTDNPFPYEFERVIQDSLARNRMRRAPRAG